MLHEPTIPPPPSLLPRVFTGVPVATTHELQELGSLPIKSDSQTPLHTVSRADYKIPWNQRCVARPQDAANHRGRLHKHHVSNLGTSASPRTCACHGKAAPQKR